MSVSSIEFDVEMECGNEHLVDQEYAHAKSCFSCALQSLHCDFDSVLMDFCSVQNKLGITLLKMKQYKRSLVHFDRALGFAIQFGPTPETVNILFNIAVVHDQLRDGLALAFAKRAYAMSVKLRCEDESIKELIARIESEG